MDPLSDVLSLLKPRSYMFRGLDASGSWSLRYPSTEGLRCFAAVTGACWLGYAGAAEPIRLRAGDCVLLHGAHPCWLASDPSLPREDAVMVFSAAPEGGTAVINGGGELSGIGGFFTFAGRHAGVLLALLPEVVHIRKESDKATLRESMAMMMRELREPRPGGMLVAQHLGQVVMILALRSHIADAAQDGIGWLRALADRSIAAAIEAMHADPARRWTLHALAGHAAMSRSVFAMRFRELAGEPPMEYLTRWRMLLASEKLANSDESISSIANSLGYQSESAFSAAFRRVMGCPPRQYARMPSEDRSPVSMQ